ncbi:hypothetical protein FHR84_000690 [Actinopolyspora biskrensis]|uniref:Uncharacterized protein n=1 Tax=Actinopolyspora biskrensis TaxID=1470178 RepID=A0A852Z146_9ACTN|nr:hypothetical protein [Actinopolyspora biskrensis]NYH77376.1 hypothetical protein [Actinopolyspora biskrensis]
MTVVGGFGFDYQDIAASLVEASEAAPINPFGGDEFDLGQRRNQGFRDPILRSPLIVSAAASCHCSW